MYFEDQVYRICWQLRCNTVAKSWLPVHTAETEIWKLRNREAFYFLCQAKGRHSRLASQELCPPFLGNYRDSYREARSKKWVVRIKMVKVLHSSSSCMISKQSPLESGNPVIGSGSPVIGSISLWVIGLRPPFWNTATKGDLLQEIIGRVKSKYQVQEVSYLNYTGLGMTR